MRLRNVKGSRETIAANDYVVHNETGMKGHWHELFGNDNPIHIEIGMGKGQFIMELARRNPDINYIGIEKYSSVLVRALEKRELEHFLGLYDQLLAPEGRVIFKTDNRGLFDFSLEQVPEAGWILENYTYDLHNSEYNEGNIMTEYETKFSAMGTPINRLVAYREKK